MKAQEYYTTHIANAYETVERNREELREKHLEAVEMLEALFDEAIEKENGAYVGDILVGGEDGITDFEDFVHEAEDMMNYTIGDIFDAVQEFYEDVSQWEVEANVRCTDNGIWRRVSSLEGKVNKNNFS